jgi:hypothetical protein
MTFAASFVAACGVLPGATTPLACDGVSAEVGGCSSERPSFEGTTCAEVAQEWGQTVDTRVKEVIAGPETVDGKQRSSRILDVLVLAYVGATKHLEQSGQLGRCHAADFLAGAAPSFSEELKAGIGGALYDGDPVTTYGQFIAEVQNVIKTLDNP